jgi:Zn-dependent M28 family amino/carboxypeptidase
MRHRLRSASSFLFLALCTGCGRAAIAPARALFDEAAASSSIDAARFVDHVARLASDEFEGRGPGTRGEEQTVAYLTEQFAAAGLAPGNPDGTYEQRVPLVGFRSRPKLQLTTRAGARTLAFPDDYVALSRQSVPALELARVPLCFVGYGVVAPEYGWDDYKDVDVRGKAIVMLVNDPQVTRADGALDEGVFQGRAMTYYGRWTYKYEIAAERGAAMAILVHETGPAGYPYAVVRDSWSRENFDLDLGAAAPQRVAVESWVREDVARTLFAECGLDFDAAKHSAARREFRPVELAGSRVDVKVEREQRNVSSRNVVAKVEGRKQPGEALVYTAHWDHLGHDESRADDGIYNGAIDNATGCAALLEIARACAALEPPPERTFLFLAVTAEEKGLLGSQYYAAHPLHPLESTLACINMDGLNVACRTRDVESTGFGNSTLHDALATAARAQGRVVVPDDQSEKGYFYRSDHFSFARRGVPGLHAGAGVDCIDRPAGYGARVRDEYVARDYHKPSDEMRPEWDIAAALDDARLFLAVGLLVSRTPEWPEWSATAEFRAIREASLR